MENEFILRIIICVLWGGLIGLEREYRSKSAGFRTMLMISIGTSLFTALSFKLGSAESHDRIASNILTGIGFLGAGVIFKGTENQLNGITTAATIWAVAAVSMAISSGHFWEGGITATSVLSILLILPSVEKWIAQINQNKSYTIKGNKAAIDAKQIEKQMKHYRLKFNCIKESIDQNDLLVHWEVSGKAKNHVQFVQYIKHQHAITYLEFINH